MMVTDCGCGVQTRMEVVRPLGLFDRSHNVVGRLQRFVRSLFSGKFVRNHLGVRLAAWLPACMAAAAHLLHAAASAPNCTALQVMPCIAMILRHGASAGAPQCWPILQDLGRDMPVFARETAACMWLPVGTVETLLHMSAFIACMEAPAQHARTRLPA